MARVQSFEKITKERPLVHGVVQCTYFTFTADDGREYLTLETYGSPRRVMPDKVSQSLQMDEQAAAALLKVIRDTFPSLR